MHKKFLALMTAAVMSISLVLTGCGNTSKPADAGEKQEVQKEAADASKEEPEKEEKDVKVGFIYIGPVKDGGWTEFHENARKYLEEQLGVESIYKENVPEGPESKKAIMDLVDQGCNIIFTTSYGYMDPTLEVAKEFPEVKFLHCSGFKTAENMATYFGRMYQPRYLSGIVAGMKTKSNKIGYVAAFEIPEVINGKKASLNSPKDSIKQGIGMIHQHFKLIDVFSAKENIITGQHGNFFINKTGLAAQIRQISEKFGLDVDPDKKVYNMSVGEKQNLEILKVLYRGAQILILDEPTAVLTPQEIEKLFKIIRNMKDAGCAVIIITHKLHEVMEISDRVTMLRRGETVGTVNTPETNIKELTELMVGRPMDLSIERVVVEDKKTVMKVNNLTVLDDDRAKALDGVSFKLKSGEILGVAGVAGSGQKELCEAIAGLYPVSGGEIEYEGGNIVGKNPRDIIKKGISMSFIPEDRLGMVLVASMDMVDNMILKEYQNQKGFLLDRKPAREKAEKLVVKLDIKTPGVYCPVKQLSGGNIQKVLLGREIGSNPRVLITAYPVRGLDIGASFTIYDLLNGEKKKGVAVLYIGEDLDVLLELCDRIMVLCDGKVTGMVYAKDITKEQLGLMMAGKTFERLKEVETVGENN